jgi:hypothetical protein
MTESKAPYTEAQTDSSAVKATFNLEPANYDFLRDLAEAERRTYSAQLNLLLEVMRGDLEATDTEDATS